MRDITFNHPPRRPQRFRLVTRAERSLVKLGICPDCHGHLEDGFFYCYRCGQDCGHIARGCWFEMQPHTRKFADEMKQIGWGLAVFLFLWLGLIWVLMTLDIP